MNEIEQRIIENAVENGWKVNQDVISMVAKGLKVKKEKFGEFYCPCNIQNTPDTICACNEFKDSDDTVCGCGLYTK